jgi:aminopeptidase N
VDQPQSLRRDEALQRSDLLRVTSYDVELDLTGLAEGDEFRARSTIRFTAARPGSATFLDCVADATRAELNGTSLDVTAAPDRIDLPGLAEDNVVVVESVQRDTASRTGVHRSVDQADGLVYVWTSFEPDDARRAWACFDQPDLKAPHRFVVTAPADWIVASNCAPESVTDGADGSRVWRFPPTPPLSTYVPVVNAGPFHEVRRQQGGFDLGLLCRRSLAPMLDRDADELFDLTVAGLHFFGERFAMPFPQQRYDQVFVPDLGGAMENYGCVTWSDWFVFRHEPTYAQRELRADVLLHEMAHMWFGDIVTMQWWDDLWLNEAFADWAATWATAAATTYTDAWATFLAGRELTGYAADRAPTTHPIRQDAPDVATAAAGFDMITYAKGASVLRQLVAYVGEEQFVAGLRQYFADHAWGNAGLDDLIGAISAAAGRNLDDWVAGWLDRAGTDTLTVRSDGGSLELSVAGPRGEPPRPHRVGVGVYTRADGGATLTRRELAVVDAGAQPVPVPVSVGPDELVLVNDEDLTFATVAPDQPALQAMLTHAADLPTALARTVAVTTVWALVTEGRLDTAEFIRCATSVLRRESAESVVEPLLDLVTAAARLWSPAAQQPEHMLAVADVCAAIADRAPALRIEALRALATVAASDAHLELLDRAAADDIDLRWRVLQRRAALNRLDETDIARTEKDDPDPDAWVRSVLVRAAAPDPQAKKDAWRAATELRVPLGMVGSLGRAFWQPGQEDVLAPFAERYVEVLPEFGRFGMIQAYAIPGAMFPIVGVGRDFLDRAQAAVAGGGVSPVVERTVLEYSDQLRRMLTARAV